MKKLTAICSVVVAMMPLGASARLVLETKPPEAASVAVPSSVPSPVVAPTVFMQPVQIQTQPVQRARPQEALLHEGNVGQAAPVTINIKKTNFVTALKTIVPKNWRGFAKEDSGILDVGLVDVQAVNQPWTDVLNDVLEKNAFVGNVNWDKKEIMFFKKTKN